MNEKFKLLLAHDGSECADEILIDLKRAGLPRKAEAHVLSVYAEWLPAPSSLGLVQTNFAKFVSFEESEALAIALRTREALKSQFPEWEVHAEAYAGSPASVIVERADRLKPDLIVVGSHGRSGFGRLFLGSVSLKVLHAAHTAVRIARGRVAEPEAPIRLIVGVDGSTGAEATVRALARRHWPRGSEARIVNGIPILPAAADEMIASEVAMWLESERARVAEVVKAAAAKLKGANLVVSDTVKEVDARHLLVSEAEAWGADCIFLGARGMGALGRLILGSVSSSVAARAHCSVEVVREMEE